MFNNSKIVYDDKEWVYRKQRSYIYIYIYTHAHWNYKCKKLEHLLNVRSHVSSYFKWKVHKMYKVFCYINIKQYPYLNCIISSYKLVPQWMLTKSQNIQKIPLMGVHYIFYIIKNKNINKSQYIFEENVNFTFRRFLSKLFVHAT